MFIKGFDKDLRCRNFQFEIGKTYDTGAKNDELELCSNKVFHFCRSLQQVHSYYDCNSKTNRYCEIEVLGVLVEDNEKCGSNKIKIVREITGDELNQLKGLERNNTGIFNTGNCNVGTWNTGNSNTGNRNTGDWNTGNSNTGNRNTGDGNTGNRNTGNKNIGSRNTGNCNVGILNTGNSNTSDSNTGSGNTGMSNTGSFNTGNFNIGNHNTGMFNSCNRSNGFFNTKEQTISIFNIDSGMTFREFIESKYYCALTSTPFILTEWIEYSKKEKKADKEKELIGGYLRKYTFYEACANWWNEMSNVNKEIIKSIPNFNAEIFKEITGIEVVKDDNTM